MYVCAYHTRAISERCFLEVGSFVLQIYACTFKFWPCVFFVVFFWLNNLSLNQFFFKILKLVSVLWYIHTYMYKKVCAFCKKKKRKFVYANGSCLKVVVDGIIVTHVPHFVSLLENGMETNCHNPQFLFQFHTTLWRICSDKSHHYCLACGLWMS